MNTYHQPPQHQHRPMLQLMGAVCGGLILGLTGMSLPTQAQTPAEPMGVSAPRAQVLQPPLPETRQAPIARVTPYGQQVDVRLINRTGTTVNYEVIGDTNLRILPANRVVTLQGLDVPKTLTLNRPDRGFIFVTTRSMSDMLEVTLYPTGNFSLDQSTLSIQPSGFVFVN